MCETNVDPKVSKYISHLKNIHIKKVVCPSVNLPIKPKQGKSEIIHFSKKVLICKPFYFINHF